MSDTEKQRRLESLKRARKADRAIHALDITVTTLCLYARISDQPFCSGCVWKVILKPLASPLIGWERGCPPHEASDPSTGGLKLIPLNDLMAELESQESRRTPATTETEKWLRSQGAWEDVTWVWMDRLEAADPGLGHGIPRTLD